MDKTNINALGQSIERCLHLIDKNLFSIKQDQFPLQIALNLFKESRRTSPLSVRRRLRLYIYPSRPEVMTGRDREWRAYRQVCGQRGRNLTQWPWQYHLSNVFLGSCWSDEYCVGFSVSFWHGPGKMDPDKSVVFGYDGVPAHLDLAIHSRPIRTQLMLPKSTSLKRI